MPYKQRGFCPFTKKDPSDDPMYAHGVRPGKTTGTGTLSKSEQKKIQRSIEFEGHFGDIDPKLLKDYGSRDSHSYRRRVAEINAHHRYLSGYDPYDKGRGKESLHTSLSRQKPGNWDSRYTDFEG